MNEEVYLTFIFTAYPCLLLFIVLTQMYFYKLQENHINQLIRKLKND